jgi:hypothetical protein
MSTIIAHGKSQWDRANKNKRVDAEIESEKLFLSEQVPQSITTTEANILKNISDTIDPGTKIIKKFDNHKLVKISSNATSPETFKRTSSSARLSHEDGVDKKYKKEDVLSSVEIQDPVIVNPIIEEIAEPVVEDVTIEEVSEIETPVVEIAETVVENTVPVKPKAKKKRFSKKKKMESVINDTVAAEVEI